MIVRRLLGFGAALKKEGGGWRKDEQNDLHAIIDAARAIRSQPAAYFDGSFVGT